VLEQNQIFVGGKLVDSSAKARIDVVSPNTEEVIGRVPDATPADVDPSRAGSPRSAPTRSAACPRR